MKIYLHTAAQVLCFETATAGTVDAMC